ncbi:MAG: NCS2 family permease [Christensenellales bacterium]|jgi:AGZA family xanthine/uracil permease-like MFS transporter
MEKLDKFFKLKENNTTLSKEILAGVTTFFAMVYIIFVNPNILSQTGMKWNAVFLATIIASFIGTIVMGLFANVPYAQAPGMGLNAFFTFTVCFGLGFSWEEALALVFICGIINIIITVTKIRKYIIKAIPKSLQNAIGGGIGIFIAYIGLKNANMMTFTLDPNHWTESFGTVFGDASAVPAITDFSTPVPILAVIGLVITIVLLLFKVRGAILIGIVATTIIGIPMGVTKVTGLFSNYDLGAPFRDLGETIGAAFYKGMPGLFSDASRIPMALLAIFAFSLTDTFDTIGTFIGTGRRTGIFSEEDLAAVEHGKGFKTKMEKALFADAIATSVGAVFGTSNTTTYIESAAGIEAGGRTGLTSVTTAVLFLLCILISPIVGIVPGAATAPALIVVGIMMAASLKDIDWADLAEAIPAFFAAVLMALFYNISIGIAFGFIFYVIVKVCKGQAKEVHPIMWACAGLFLLYFVLMALNGAGII